MKIDRCPTCHRRKTRSSHANALYWALLHRMAEGIRPRGQAYSADSWHLWAKSRFLGCDDVRLPSGKVLPVARSTAGLDVAEFADYLDRVQAWANERGVWLEDHEAAA